MTRGQLDERFFGDDELLRAFPQIFFSLLLRLV